MKRIGAILCLSIVIILAAGTVAFGASFNIEKTTPEDGSTGMSVDNMGVKVFFSQDVYNPKNNDNNAKKCKLIDEKGKEVSSKVVFNKNKKDIMLVLATAQTKDGKTSIKGKTKYTLIIDKEFVAVDGTALGEQHKTTFTTLDPKQSMTVSMVMMGVMVVGMVFMTTREAKKQAQAATKKKDEKVNPYKVAKETGKSVEQIVEKENKKKEKQDAAKAKKERQKKENKVEIASENFRVPRPRPISEVGIEYKHKKKKTNNKAKSTNPKNQSGKQKNKNKK